MHGKYTSRDERAGISEKNRRLLTLLHRRLEGPFTAGEACEVLPLDHGRTSRLLAYLCSRGWLARVRRGLYTTVPLEASRPSEWRADPWAVAMALFSPGYIGGWSACEHWGLTDQIFREVLVVTAHRVRDRTPVIQGASFRVKVVDERKIFGTRRVWRSAGAVAVSDPARTVVDLLDDPSLGGGMRTVHDIVLAWFDSQHRDDEMLLDHACRVGNGAVFKRLGYLLDHAEIEASELANACRRHMTTGLARLDPGGPLEGRILKAWNLRVNVTLPPSGEDV